MWDVRKQDSLWQLEGHTDIVTGLSLSPSGSYILSNAMDDTTRKWDVRSYVNGSRLACTFYGVKVCIAAVQSLETRVMIVLTAQPRAPFNQMWMVSRRRSSH